MKVTRAIARVHINAAMCGVVPVNRPKAFRILRV
jgi:hypothetical protein